MATLEEIRVKAAKKLGLLGVGQTLRSTIDDDLTNAYTEVYAEIETLGLATWAVTDDIPDQFVFAVTSWVAGSRLDEYNVPLEKYQRVANDFAKAEPTIRRLQAQPLQGTTEHEPY